MSQNTGEKHPLWHRNTVSEWIEMKTYQKRHLKGNDEIIVKRMRKIARQTLDRIYQRYNVVQNPSIFISDDITIVISWSKNTYDTYLRIARMEEDREDREKGTIKYIELSLEGRDYSHYDFEKVFTLLVDKLTDMGCLQIIEISKKDRGITI